jgi:hypothetical protein
LKKLALVALVMGSACLAGCATSRSEVALVAPTASSAKAPPNGRTVVIRDVKDDRVFEEAPPQPSTPSLGAGGAAAATELIKARAIARKRNSFGQALGDVLLQEGQTVTGLVRSSLNSAFEQAGYRVVTTAGSGGTDSPGATVVDVSIRKFWAWMQPGFWALTFNANLETALTTMTPGSAPTVISVTTNESRQVGTDDAWIKVVQKAMAQYQMQAASKLSGPPF